MCWINSHSHALFMPEVPNLVTAWRRSNCQACRSWHYTGTAANKAYAAATLTQALPWMLRLQQVSMALHGLAGDDDAAVLIGVAGLPVTEWQLR